MEAKICAFTGHRTIHSRHASSLPERVDALLEELIASGFNEFRAGGAMGFDTLVALKVIEKREKYPQVKLCLYLPCHDQERAWDNNLKTAYAYVLEHADSYKYCSERYFNGCMHKRNRDMLEGASLCAAYCGSGSGGTAYTVGYAQKQGIRVVNLFK